MVTRLQALGLSLLVLYFAYHAFAGEKGLGRWTDSQIELENRQRDLAQVQDEIERLRADIRRLTPGAEDPDYVEALARDKLAFVYPGEIVLLVPERSSAN
ncbi:MAG: septum formation initiator family protein [Acidobacteria bacterium]|jgi:cell division protein FtsB|nr:septum formation initiator family protein [Acidobacteriota bacterium]